MKGVNVRWIIAWALFAIASVAIHYEVKVVMHQRMGLAQQLRKLQVGPPDGPKVLKQQAERAIKG